MTLKKIYFDMDGVVADFDRGVRELAGFNMSETDQDKKSAAEDKAMWEHVKRVPNFYDKLEPMPRGFEMFKAVKQAYPGIVEILTGIPKPHRGIETAGEDKIAWSNRLMGEDIPVHIVFKEEKKNFATGKDCVLIDDRGKNIEEWEEAGGSGIFYKEGETDIMKELEKICQD